MSKPFLKIDKLWFYYRHEISTRLVTLATSGDKSLRSLARTL